MPDEYLGKWLFTATGSVPGYLRIRDDTVEEVCEGSAPVNVKPSIVLPGFVNAHTHVGDSFAYPAPRGTVEETVGPGGFKHRMLAEAPSSVKTAGMKASLDLMEDTGTAAFVDFREEGYEGVCAVLDVVRGRPLEATVLGRPKKADSCDEEVASILKVADGLAFSSVSDWPLEVLEAASAKCRDAGKAFSLHASESVREDIDDILGLRPSFVVHMTSATDDDVAACAGAGVPIVVCPSSNRFFGMAPDIPRMLRLGADVALGTDNAMICSPDMLRELRAAYGLCHGVSGITPAEIVCLATLSGRKVLNPKGKITTEMSTSDHLVVLDVQGGEDPLLDVVSFAGSARLSAVAHGGKVRRRCNWTT